MAVSKKETSGSQTAAKTGKKKAAAKTAPKKTVTPKTAAKKTAVKKAPATKAPAKKAPATKATAKKAPATKTAASKTAASKAPAKKTAVKKVTVPKPVVRPSTLKAESAVQPRPPFQPVPTLAQTLARKKAKKPRFSRADLEFFRKELIALRDRFLSRSGSMKDEVLVNTDEINPEEDGTYASLRLQMLDQVKNQNELIAKINTALRAIDDGTYGICCNCGELIRKQRLAVLPFAKHCITCQSKLERPRYGRA